MKNFLVNRREEEKHFWKPHILESVIGAATYCESIWQILGDLSTYYVKVVPLRIIILKGIEMPMSGKTPFTRYKISIFRCHYNLPVCIILMVVHSGSCGPLTPPFVCTSQTAVLRWWHHLWGRSQRFSVIVSDTSATNIKIKHSLTGSGS